MKKVLFIGASLLSSSLAFAQTAPTKVGIINIQAAIIGTREGQAAAKALEAKSLPKKKDLENLQADINGLKDKLGKLSSVGSDEQKTSLARDIDAKTKSFNRQVEDAQAELDQEQGRLLNELGGKVLAVLDKYAKDNGFTLILDVSAQNTPVMFAANGSDVTQDVVALYDKNAPGATSSAAPSGSPASGSPVSAAPVTTPAKAVTPGITRPPAAPKPAGAK
ncbi:MAG: OmpH family outer membrane protein [Bryobacteraceae bacterium]|nr:OmpH family outer membrane protein [Bryobacteraceae bacterium]